MAPGELSHHGKRAADSPAHSPHKLPTAKKHHWADLPDSHTSTATEYTAPLAAFPAADTPASESTIKAMLLSLQAGLQSELRSSVSHLTDRMEDIEIRTEQLETQMAAVIKAHDEIIDAHEDRADTIRKLQLKVADLKDRSRRNNIKIRGVTEVVKPQELIPYLQQLFMKLIPDLTPRDLLMDRAHRIPKPTYLPDTVLRDVLT